LLISECSFRAVLHNPFAKQYGSVWKLWKPSSVL